MTNIGRSNQGFCRNGYQAVGQKSDHNIYFNLITSFFRAVEALLQSVFTVNGLKMQCPRVAIDESIYDYEIE